MEDIYKLIDDINLQKLDNLDTRVNDALSSPKDDALFILGETLYNYGLMPQGLEVFRTLYHKYPDESELLIYFIEGLIAEDQTDEALEYLSTVELSTERLMLEADLYQQLNMLEVAIDKLVDFIKKKGIKIEKVLPGLSSFQYLMAELQKSWNDASFLSLHGREDFLIRDSVKRLTVILTDAKNTPSFISKKLHNLNIKGKIYVGFNLSHSDEKIVIKNIGEEIEDISSLAVVVIEREVD